MLEDLYFVIFMYFLINNLGRELSLTNSSTLFTLICTRSWLINETKRAQISIEGEEMDIGKASFCKNVEIRDFWQSIVPCITNN